MSPLIAKAHTISTVLIWQLNGALGAIFRAEICFDSDLLSSSSSSGGEMARIQKLLLLLLAWNSCTVAFLCIQHPLHTGTKLWKMLSIFSNFYVLIFIRRWNGAHPKTSCSSCLELLHCGNFILITPLTHWDQTLEKCCQSFQTFMYSSSSGG